MDCQYCHTGVTYSDKAGIPPLSTCLNCHMAIGYSNKEVQKIHDYVKKNKSPEWVRVHNMPDHVKFSHAPHIKALLKPGQPTKTSCVPCHGNVPTMKVVTQVKSLNMGFCIDCHRKEESKMKGADTDCSTCHY